MHRRQSAMKPADTASEGRRVAPVGAGAHEATRHLQRSIGNQAASTLLHPGTVDTSEAIASGGLRSERFGGSAELQNVLDGQRVLHKVGNPRSDGIRRIQSALVDMGYELPQFGVDGIFGSETERAVVQLQADFDVVPADGIVGSDTMRRLDDLAFYEERGGGPPRAPPAFVRVGFLPTPVLLSVTLTAFEAAVAAQDWQLAAFLLNGLNMTEMVTGLANVRTLAALKEIENAAVNHDPARFGKPSHHKLNVPRIRFALFVVRNGRLPPLPHPVPGSQGTEAARAIAGRRLQATADAVNKSASGHLGRLVHFCALNGVHSPAQVAYVLATAHHESEMGHVMVERQAKGVDEKTYFKNKYWHNKTVRDQLGNTHEDDAWIFKGRGYIQLTGRAHYRAFGLDTLALAKTAAEPDRAAAIIVTGMREGEFTPGFNLERFERPDADPKTNPYKYDFVNARQIVNGHDRATEIAELAKKYFEGMKWK